jgi:predicted NBD/HSP70 family sugar kinase
VKNVSVSTVIRGNRDLFKEINSNLLLNIIRREGQVSRKQLTDISGLSVGAVSGIVSELLLRNWILEIGEGDYTGGRRQTLIKLNSKAGYAVGLKLMEQRAVVAITNFEAEIVHYQEESRVFAADPQALARSLAAIIKAALEQSQIPPDRFFGVGVGVAGAVETNKGIVHNSPFFGWHNVPLAELIEAEIQLPVYIENDVNTLTLTEQLFGAGRHYANFVVVTIGRGIGMGLVINNQLYRGFRGGAGELGHTILVQQQRDDSAVFTSLEDIAADPAVIGDSVRVLKNGSVSLDLNTVATLADQGEPWAQAALRRSGQMLGLGLANVVNILNPELVIISGEGIIAGDHRLAPMLEAMKQYSFNGLLDNVAVVIEATDDQAWARGAASLVISKVFESPMVEARSNG